MEDMHVCSYMLEYIFTTLAYMAARHVLHVHVSTVACASVCFEFKLKSVVFKNILLSSWKQDASVLVSASLSQQEFFINK
jgi:hypothetical protein